MRLSRKPKRLGFFAMLAALLGITAGCKGGGSNEVICMYGVPTVSYELKGKVTDEGGKPVEGIEVSFARVAPSDSALVGSPFGPTVLTDAAGQWNIHYQDDPTSILKVTFTDVDGSENGGAFAEANTIVKDVQPVKDPKDNNAFNLGEVKLEIPVVKLKKN
jgi:putative lipoprotein (rSAM/lipoprotein system)